MVVRILRTIIISTLCYQWRFILYYLVYLLSYLIFIFKRSRHTRSTASLGNQSDSKFERDS